MATLTKRQLKKKSAFVTRYLGDGNNATLSTHDPNANTSMKCVATLASEVNKDTDVDINRYLLGERIKKLFGKKAQREYYRSLDRHEIYSHDESAVVCKPYCMSMNLFPFLSDGMQSLGGESKAPQHLASFCGSYVNLIFAISSNFAGAVADSSFLTFFNYFAQKDYGDDYLDTHAVEIENAFQHIIYSISQPASARGFQSCFWNISIFDENYFSVLLGNTPMPDGGTPNWEQVKKLQKHFMAWFNKERTKALLTFPVISAAILTKDGHAVDSEFKEFLAKEMSEGNSFFIYSSDNINSISQCCRLRSELDMNTFAYTLGSTGLDTGSKKVFTININRLIQDGRDIKEEVKKIHRYLIAYNDILYEMKEAGMLPVYDAGYITLEKQYLTIGVNGVVEAAEYLGYDINYNDDYVGWLQEILSAIGEVNKEASKEYTQKYNRKVMFNTEFVPAENLGVKFAKWDKRDGYMVPRDCYNSYMFKSEDDSLDLFEKLQLHGKDVVQYLDGGSACHIGLQEIPSKETWMKIIDYATKVGCNYFCYNVVSTCCNSCGYIDKNTRTSCVKCNSTDIDYITRVIGYIKKIKSFAQPRQIEASKRFYHKPLDITKKL